MKPFENLYSETELEQIANETNIHKENFTSLNSLCGKCENSCISISKPLSGDGVVFDYLEAKTVVAIRCDANGCAVNLPEYVMTCDRFVEDKQKKDRLLNGFVKK